MNIKDILLRVSNGRLNQIYTFITPYIQVSSWSVQGIVPDNSYLYLLECL